jgi:hypothetical protein
MMLIRQKYIRENRPKKNHRVEERENEKLCIFQTLRAIKNAQDLEHYLCTAREKRVFIFLFSACKIFTFSAYFKSESNILSNILTLKIFHHLVTNIHAKVIFFSQ